MPVMASNPKEEDHEYYPNMSVDGDAAEKLGNNYEVGDEFTANVKFKVTGFRENGESRSKYGSGPGDEKCCIELEAVSIEPEGMADDQEAEATASDAIDEYRKGKTTEEADEE